MSEPGFGARGSRFGARGSAFRISRRNEYPPCDNSGTANIRGTCDDTIQRPSLQRALESVQHLTCASDRFRQVFHLLRGDERPSEGDLNLCIELCKGSEGNPYVAQERSIPSMRMAFGHIARNGNGRSLQVCGQNEPLVLRQTVSHVVDVNGQVHRRLPHLEISKRSDGALRMARHVASHFPHCCQRLDLAVSAMFPRKPLS